MRKTLKYFKSQGGLKMKKKISFSLSLALCMILFYPALIASTYYVDKNHSSANNENPGTLDLPWLTILHAAETLVAGDTVFIRDGVYNEWVYIDNSGNSTEGPIVFHAYPGESPIIDGTGVTEGNNGIIIDKDYINLVGLEVRNWNENGIWIENSAFFEISDCKVYDVMYGIGVADGSHDFIFDRVEVYNFDLYGFDVSTSGGSDCYNGIFNDCVSHTGRDPNQNVDGFALGHGTQHNFILNNCITYGVFDGFDISSMNSILNGCLAYDMGNSGYKLWQDNVLLVNCIGYDAEIAIVELDWDGDPGATTLMNCTFYDARTFTVWIENSGDILNMYNCIISGGDNIGLAFEQRNASNYFGDHNIFHNNNINRAVVVGYEDEFTIDNLISGDWSTYSGQDNNSKVCTDLNSLIVSPEQPNLHLAEGSPAIDNGTTEGAPDTDYDGISRPYGDGIDIGAYEYNGPSSIGENSDIINSPKNIILYQNYPNPFNPCTTICFHLPHKSFVSLRIFNALGEEVRSLINKIKESGHHQVQFSGMGLPSGTYFYKLDVQKNFETVSKIFTDSKKFVMLK